MTGGKKPWYKPVGERPPPKEKPRKNKQIEKRIHSERMKDPIFAEAKRKRSKSEADRLREWKANASPEDLLKFREAERERRKRYLSNPETREKRKAWKRTHYDKQMAFINSHKKQCFWCGESHPACLQFHHRDPKHKVMNVCAMASGSRRKIIEEIAKCDVMCANCHLKTHAEEGI